MRVLKSVVGYRTLQVEESKENSKSFWFANALGDVDNLFFGGNFAHFIWHFFNAGLLVQKIYYWESGGGHNALSCGRRSHHTLIFCDS